MSEHKERGEIMDEKEDSITFYFGGEVPEFSVPKNHIKSIYAFLSANASQEKKRMKESSENKFFTEAAKHYENWQLLTDLAENIYELTWIYEKYGSTLDEQA